jgi:hypothetical protein
MAFLFVLLGPGDSWVDCEGTVRTADGTLLQGIEVVLTLDGGGDSDHSKSQADGSYSVLVPLPRFGATACQLEVSEKSYRRYSRKLAGGSHKLDIVLEPTQE